MYSAGDGFRAIRELAKQAAQVTLKHQTPCERLYQDLAHEAQKFLIYRAWGYRDRQSLALQRMRTILSQLQEEQLRKDVS